METDSPKPPARPVKILLVEDDEFLVKMYETGFTHEGFAVTSATDGEQALRLVKTYKPDIVLLDLILPKRDGFDVLTALKKDPATRDLPVVILSNLGQESDVKKCIEAGAADFLIKANFTVKGVAEKIRSLMAAGR